MTSVFFTTRSPEMKRLLTAAVLSLTIAAPNAFAGDTRVELPLQDLIDSPQAKEAGRRKTVYGWLG